MAGDEMFYSKVRLVLLHTHKTKDALKTNKTHTHLYQIYPDCGSFLRQKRTWESNKNDIRVCRMKGKHEVTLRSTLTCVDTIYTITRMDRHNSCWRNLISSGCTCIWYLHKFDGVDTESASLNHASSVKRYPGRKMSTTA